MRPEYNFYWRELLPLACQYAHRIAGPSLITSRTFGNVTVSNSWHGVMKMLCFLLMERPTIHSWLQSVKSYHIVLLLINVLIVVSFGAAFMTRLNYEFVIYVGVIIFFLCLIVASIHKVDYTPASLVGLTVWLALHLSGGWIRVGNGVLYGLVIIPLSARFPVLRYDQLVHIWGFGSATLVMYCLLQRSLDSPWRNPIAVSIVIIAAGLGVGAFNEIVEFIVSETVPESGVGMYLNTSLDLCADLVGAILGLLYIRLRYSEYR